MPANATLIPDQDRFSLFAFQLLQHLHAILVVGLSMLPSAPC